MKLTYLAQSGFLAETTSHKLLIDPFLSGNPLAVTDPESLECDYILLTHGHGDHLGDTIPIARRTGATVIATFELAMYLANKGLSVHPMGIGGQFSFPFGNVKFTIAHHSSGFIEEDGTIICLGNPAGLLLKADDLTIYHAGDTALFYDMKLIGEANDIDMAILPIGDNFTMGIDDSLKAVDFLKPKRVIPVHFNTFPIIEADPEMFKAKCPVPVDVLVPGESLEL